jgi:hypothetical protein
VARKRKKPDGPPVGDRFQKLVDLARSLGLPDGAFDDDLEDAANREAELIFELMTSESLYRQLEFLYLHGFDLGRLEELIRERSTDQ